MSLFLWSLALQLCIILGNKVRIEWSRLPR